METASGKEKYLNCSTLKVDFPLRWPLPNASMSFYVLREFPADLINLQRLCQTLVGVAGAVGAGQPSCAAMWRRQCEAVVAGEFS